MSDSTRTTSDFVSGSEFGLEACEYINQQEADDLRGSFHGLLQDAPMTSTATVNALSQQLIYQLQLILPGVFVSFDDLKVNLSNVAFPYLQAPAKEALQQAISDRSVPMQVNSAYRTVAQQMLLYCDRFNNPSPVAPPGRSNHQTGLALDVEDPQGWEPYLIRYGWKPLRGDRPHFDYRGGGTIDVRSQSILAFQQLWNNNNLNEKIGEDGEFGPETEAALRRSPAQGFVRAPWDIQPRLLHFATPRMEGSDVLALQECLKKSGIAVDVDGEFGPRTDKAVKAFQAEKMLKTDGIVGAKTREFLA